MAEILPDEGLDLILGVFPRGGTITSPTQLALFTSQSASTVITSGQTIANITETVFTNYVRQALAAATWGAQGVGTGGRKCTYPQVTFPTVGATGATINGFYITDNGVTKAICQANFDDGLAVVLALNDIIRVTPALTYQN
jgi:uncharacterized membrane protein